MMQSAELKELFREFLSEDSIHARVEEFRTDFGKTISRTPLLVILSKSEKDTQTTLRIARKHRIPIVVRGTGHSCAGQTLTDTGVVLVNYSTSGLDMDWTEEGHLNVSGRSIWRSVKDRLARHGAAMPVLADHLDMSVGGTLAVGGYGLGSITFGAQVDGVRALRVVRADGETVWCSPNQHQDLFRFSLAGLGQLGIIERAIMDVTPLPESIYHTTCQYPDIHAFIRSLECHRQPGRPLPNYFNGWVMRGEIQAQYGFVAGSEKAARTLAMKSLPMSSEYSPPDKILDYEQFIHQQRATWVNRYPKHRRVWCDYLFEYEGFYRFMNYIHETWNKQQDLKDLAVIYVLMVRRRSGTFTLPFASSHLPGGERVLYAVGMYYMVPNQNPFRVLQATQGHRRWLEKCIELGGRPYRYGWCNLSDMEKRQIYGESFDNAIALKKRWDPDHLLNPGIF